MKCFNSLFLILCIAFVTVIGSVISDISYAQTTISKKISIENSNLKIAELQQKIDSLSNDNQFLQIELFRQQQIAADWKNQYDVLVQNDSLFYPARLFYWINRWSMTPLSQINIESIPIFFVMGANGVLIIVCLVVLMMVKVIAFNKLKKSIDSGKSNFSDSDSIATKLDLARAYIDMKEYDSARAILKEVILKGDMGQQREAKRLMENCR